MTEYSSVNRPLLLDEIADVFGVDPGQLDRLTKERGIAPAFTVRRLAFYGPRQVQRIYDLLISLSESA